MDAIRYPDIPELNEHEKLIYEKECLGFYLTGHPLNKVFGVLNKVYYHRHP